MKYRQNRAQEEEGIVVDIGVDPLPLPMVILIFLPSALLSGMPSSELIV